jgi:hypothetical protein
MFLRSVRSLFSHSLYILLPERLATHQVNRQELDSSAYALANDFLLLSGAKARSEVDQTL